MIPIITPESYIIWDMYRAINGTQNETFESYKKLPALWVEVCKIIDSEIDRIERIKAAEEKRKHEAAIRRARSQNRRY